MAHREPYDHQPFSTFCWCCRKGPVSISVQPHDDNNDIRCTDNSPTQKEFHLFEWITFVFTLIFLLIPMTGFHYRDKDMDSERNKVLLSDSIHLHWSFIALIAFMFNHLIYIIGDLIGFRNDVNTRKVLLLNNRIIISIAAVVPAVGFYLSGAMAEDRSIVSITACYAIQISWFGYVICLILATSRTKLYVKWHLQTALFLLSVCNALNVFCNASMLIDETPFSAYLYYIYWILYIGVAIYWFIYSAMYCWMVDVRRLLFSPETEELQETIVLVTVIAPYAMFIFFLIFFFTIQMTNNGRVESDKYDILNEVTGYNIFSILFTIPLLIIPERLTRKQLKKLETTLTDTSDKINTQLLPEVVNMIDSLQILRNPSALHAIFLDPEFRRHFQIVVEGCERVLQNVENLGGLSNNTYTIHNPSDFENNDDNHVATDSKLPTGDNVSFQQASNNTEDQDHGKNENWDRIIEEEEEDEDEMENKRELSRVSYICVNNLSYRNEVEISMPSRIREFNPLKQSMLSGKGALLGQDSSSSGSFHPKFRVSNVEDLHSLDLESDCRNTEVHTYAEGDNNNL